MYTTSESIAQKCKFNSPAIRTDRQFVRKPSCSFLNDSSIVSVQQREAPIPIEKKQFPDFDSRRSSDNSLSRCFARNNYEAYSPILPQKIMQLPVFQSPKAEFPAERKSVLMQSIQPLKYNLLESQSTFEPQDFLLNDLETLPELNESPTERQGNSRGESSPQFLPIDLADHLGIMLANMDREVCPYSKAVISEDGISLHKANSPTGGNVDGIKYLWENEITPTSMGYSEEIEFINEENAVHGFPRFRFRIGSKSPSMISNQEIDFHNRSPNNNIVVSMPESAMVTERLKFSQIDSLKNKFSSENHLVKVPPLKITQKVLNAPRIESKRTERQKDDDFSSRFEIEFSDRDRNELQYKIKGFNSSQNISYTARCMSSRSETLVTNVIESQRKVTSDQLNRSPIKKPPSKFAEKGPLSMITEGVDSPSELQHSIVRSSKGKSNFSLLLSILGAYYNNMSQSIRSALLNHGTSLDRQRELDQRRARLASQSQAGGDHFAADIDDILKLHDRQNLFNMSILTVSILVVVAIVFRM